MQMERANQLAKTDVMMEEWRLSREKLDYFRWEAAKKGYPLQPIPPPSSTKLMSGAISKFIFDPDFDFSNFPDNDDEYMSRNVRHYFCPCQITIISIEYF